jgi:hypothetical protein
LSEFAKPGTDPCLDRSKGLIQPFRNFEVSQFGEKCGFNNPALFRREDIQGISQGISQEAGLLLKVIGLLWVIRYRRCKWIVLIIDRPLFPMFEAQPVDRSGARLIQNPPDDGPARRIVSRCSSPHVVEHIQRQLFGGFAIVGYPHYQCKNDPMRLFVK